MLAPGKEDLFESVMWVAKAVAHRLGPCFASRHFDEADAEQEALLGVIEAVNSFDPARGLTLRAWCFGIAARRAIDGYRRVVGRNGTIRNVALLQRQAGDGLLRTDNSDRDQDMLAITDAELERVDHEDEITQLSRGFGVFNVLILRLYYLENMTMKEIGALIGRSEGRVSQILKDLRARGAEEELWRLTSK
jgi:RNA polymerase sigma factor (sigma-70 family)